MHDIDPHLIFPSEGSGKRFSRLRGKYAFDWVEDSYGAGFDTHAFGAPGTSHMGSSFSEKRAVQFFVIAGIFFLMIIARLLYVQVIQGSTYRAYAEGNRQRVIPIPAERGLIYDREMRVLTKNIPNFSLALIPQDLPRNQTELDGVITHLAGLVHADTESIKKIIDAYKNYERDSIIIQEDIDYETALAIKIHAPELPGVYVQQGGKRLYLKDTASTTSSHPSLSLSHVLGYIGKLNPEELDELYPRGYLPSDVIGKVGIEKSYESYLRGVYGRRRLEVNALGREQSVIAEQASYPGAHLQLSIDEEIQNNLERIMTRHLQVNGKHRAVGIAMDPRNGEILALVNLPTFDNNVFSGGIDAAAYNEYITNEDKPLFNRAISGTYPSGSTVKPAIAASALEEGVITPKTTVLSVGGIHVGKWFFPDWLPGGHGLTSVTKSLAWSVNTFYYYVGGGYGDFTGLGVRRLVEHLQKFGLSEKLGIDLPGEESGFLPSPEWKQEAKSEQWYIGDTYNLSIGQGDLSVTPLQIASLTSVVANGGTLYRPHMVHAIINPLTNERKAVDAEIIRSHVSDDASLRTVAQGMRDCVVYGSCRRLGALPFAVAGKTGTAQWHSQKENHAWFTSFAPFDHPEIVVTVLVEEGGEGSGIAAAIAHEFYGWWGKYRLKS